MVAAVPGTALDADATAAALTVAALRTTDRTAEVAVKTTEADRTTEEAEAMGIKDKLGGYTTEPYEGTWDRQVNVRLTTKYANNVLLAPGEEYNFDKIIGPRTPERGYRLAKGITGPGKLEDVLGGGICQVSTTLFNAVFEAGLKITERHNHTLFIAHYPPGQRRDGHRRRLQLQVRQRHRRTTSWCGARPTASRPPSASTAPPTAAR